MPTIEKCKITVEIPTYLKEWIESHDLSQNALIVLGLRRLYKEDINNSPKHLIDQLLKEIRESKMPF